MPNPEISSFKQLLLTFALVFVGGVFVYASLDVPEIQSEKKAQKIQRTLASTSSERTTQSFQEKKIFELSPEFCTDQFQKEVQHSKNFIQLSGRLCSASTLKITHLESNYSATVLPVGAQKFLTDVIPLKSGINSLQIEGQNAKGSRFTSRLLIEHKL